jgi:hypothetical protein
MMKHEFERIAGYKVTVEDYENIIEPMYMATNLSKEDFAKTLNKKFFTDRLPKTPKNIKRMRVRNRMGSPTTPNGCYTYIEWVELIDVDIRTGKCIVKALEDEDLRKIAEQGNSLDTAYGFDMDYTRCVDTKKKPIALHWSF